MKSNVKCGAALVGTMLLLSTVPVLLSGAPLAGQERDPRASRGEQVFVSQGCYGCHLISKFGTPIGPELSRVGAKYPASYLRQWLRDPESVRPTAHMPKLELSPEEIDSLAAYLASLK
ncbi:MAG TPA: c-type cytochrome [Candidatus Acidoferrum sp.]|nr:c-type cytochrome [Candidatus Acidoferrum sp.]